MTQPQILNIKLGREGVQIVLNALAKLPFEQVVELIAVIKFQAEQQLNPQPEQKPAPKTEAKAAPVKRRGGRPKGSRNKAKPVIKQTTTTEGAALQ